MTDTPARRAEKIPGAAHAACPQCGRPFDVVRQCSDCGVEFTLTHNQQMFFLERGLQQPRRCEKCRFRRKQASE